MVPCGGTGLCEVGAGAFREGVVLGFFDASAVIVGGGARPAMSDDGSFCSSDFFALSDVSSRARRGMVLFIFFACDLGYLVSTTGIRLEIEIESRILYAARSP